MSFFDEGRVCVCLFVCLFGCFFLSLLISLFVCWLVCLFVCLCVWLPHGNTPHGNTSIDTSINFHIKTGKKQLILAILRVQVTSWPLPSLWSQAWLPRLQVLLMGIKNLQSKVLLLDDFVICELKMAYTLYIYIYILLVRYAWCWKWLYTIYHIYISWYAWWSMSLCWSSSLASPVFLVGLPVGSLKIPT